MARFTDTRAKVRALAEEALARGEEPSPTAILRALGRGSASTVVDELRRWRRQRAAPAAVPGRARPHDAPGEGPVRAPGPEAVQWSTVQAALERLSAGLAAAESRNAEQQALALERLTAVQRMALMSIEEAREQARFWKQAAQQARDDAAVKADAYRQAMLGAQSESRRLAERVRELEASLESLKAVARAAAPPPRAPAQDAASRLVRTAPSSEAAVTGSVDPDGPTE